jgi:hypothetical protein
MAGVKVTEELSKKMQELSRVLNKLEDSGNDLAKAFVSMTESSENSEMT